MEKLIDPHHLPRVGIDDLKRRFAALVQERGFEAAVREVSGSLDRLAPAPLALRRALISGLMQDERGQCFYPKD
ncbi:MAG: hypothetical protein ACOY4D_03080 [Pseudomonadota bacterium]